MDDAEVSRCRDLADALRGSADRASLIQFGRECAEVIVPNLTDALARLKLEVGGEDLASKLVGLLEAQIIEQGRVPEEIVLHRDCRVIGVTAMMGPNHAPVRVQINLELGKP